MSRMNDAKGIAKVFLQMAKEEFYFMDRKLLRIGTGVLGFLIAGAIWYFFFRGLTPFG